MMVEYTEKKNIEPVLFKLSELKLAYENLPYYDDQMEGQIVFEKLADRQFQLTIFSVAGFFAALGKFSFELPPTHWLHSFNDHFSVDMREFAYQIELFFDDGFRFYDDKAGFLIGQPDDDGISTFCYDYLASEREMLAG
jgi:hypothetical protein